MAKSTIRATDPRDIRARRFAAQISNMLDDWLPRGGSARKQIFDELYCSAYEANAEIISVPTECDEMDKLELERARVEQHPVLVRLNQKP